MRGNDLASRSNMIFLKIFHNYYKTHKKELGEANYREQFLEEPEQ
jgi:hypothetical protein